VVAALIGEYGATSRGWFYGHYVFADVPYKVLGLPSYKIVGVPLEGLFSWAISIYLAYCITNLIFRGYRSDVRRTLTYSLIPFLAAIDGILVVNVNMLTDPIAVQAKAFYYVNGVVGEYFGIPAFAFVSWFLTIFLITALFRSYELRGIKRRQYDHSVPSQLLRGRTVSAVDILPLFVFLVWALIRYGALALVYKHVELVLIGIAGMVPSAIIFLLAYFVLKYEKATDNVTDR
jgi:putative membrane protein